MDRNRVVFSKENMRGNTLIKKKIAEMAGKGEVLVCDIFELWAFETKMKIMKKITCMFL